MTSKIISKWPSIPAGVRRAFRFPWRTRTQLGHDLDDEMRFHLEMRIADLRTAGLSHEMARVEALRRFGDADDLRAYCRAIEAPRVRRLRARDWLTGWTQDVRFALRQCRKTPGFTTIAILTLALGIGANSAIFSAVHRLLLAPLPYADGDRIVSLQRTSAHNQVLIAPTPELVDAWRARAHTLEGITTFRQSELTLTDGSAAPELLHGADIAPELPRFLGVRPLLGRGFTAQEGLPGAPAVAMLGYGLWQRRFGGDRDVLGRTVRLDGKPYTVVGVMPREFGLAIIGDRDARQVFTPLVTGPDETWFSAIGKLRPGVTAEAATRELSAIAETAGDAKRFSGFGASATSAREAVAGNYREALLILFGAVGLVLLIACANVANLMLARAWTRQREFAIRTALGAGRARVIRQLLTESMMLALAGGTLGVVLAWRGLHLIVALRPRTMSALDDVRMEPAVLAWSVVLALVTGVLFGLAPAFLATERGIGASLKEATHTAAGSAGSRRFRGTLVVAEIALSVVLLVGAGLLVRSFIALERVDIGIDARGLFSVELQLPPDHFPSPASRAATLAQVVERVRAVPGVHAITLANGAPPHLGIALGQLEIEGRTLPTAQRPSLLGFGMVQPNYFSTVGIPIRQGRVFSGDTTERALMVSEGFARRFFPAGDAVGAHIRTGSKAPWSTVIGVVGDVRSPGELADWDRYTLYEAISLTLDGGALVIRADADLARVMPGVTKAIAALDPAIRIRQVRTTEAKLAEMLAARRFLMALLGAFALLALLLSAVGLYGVIAYSVSQRTREIGVRVALGAQATDVVRLVLGQALRLAALGIALGGVSAAAATRALRSQLFEVAPDDPATFVTVGLVLSLVAVVASLVPARRATRIDPMVALRAGD